MRLPGFTAARSLYPRASRFRAQHTAASPSDTVVPAIPFCGNCDEILDRCAENGGFPRAVCRACAYGNCYSGVENPPQEQPGFPRDWFPRW
ncbi:MAG: hypothetical protein ACRD1U_11960 [Vicinamibacterales bacterium]